MKVKILAEDSLPIWRLEKKVDINELFNAVPFRGNICGHLLSFQIAEVEIDDDHRGLLIFAPFIKFGNIKDGVESDKEELQI